MRTGCTNLVIDYNEDLGIHYIIVTLFYLSKSEFNVSKSTQDYEILRGSYTWFSFYRKLLTRNLTLRLQIGETPVLG